MYKIMFLMRYRWYRQWITNRVYRRTVRLARDAGWTDEQIAKSIPRFKESV